MPIFPLPILPRQGYHKVKWHRCWFGATRDDGRTHAACDLVVKRGTPVYAVDSGKISFVRNFYLGTDEIVIKHPGFTVRYGEVERGKFPPNIAEGKDVQLGQLIGWVGKLGMLHFEMYKGTEEGYPTQKWNKTNYKFVTPGNYQRRPDLIDPTPFLDDSIMFLKAADWLKDKIDDLW